MSVQAKPKPKKRTKKAASGKAARTKKRTTSKKAAPKKKAKKSTTTKKTKKKVGTKKKGAPRKKTVTREPVEIAAETALAAVEQPLMAMDDDSGEWSTLADEIEQMHATIAPDLAAVESELGTLATDEQETPPSFEDTSAEPVTRPEPATQAPITLDLTAVESESMTVVADEPETPDPFDSTRAEPVTEPEPSARTMITKVPEDWVDALFAVLRFDEPIVNERRTMVCLAGSFLAGSFFGLMLGLVF